MAKGFHLVAMVAYQGMSAAGDWILPATPESARVDKDVIESDPNLDAFHQTNLASLIRERGIERVMIAGLTTQGAVRETVLGSVREGFETWVAVDAVAEDPAIREQTDRALLEMRTAGVAFGTAGQLATIIKHQPHRTALVVLGLQKEHLPGGLRPIPRVSEIANLIEQLIEFGCRQIHRSPEELLA
jgi:nicotinamidase-related amidase